jgi:hypothetical protein
MLTRDDDDNEVEILVAALSRLEWQKLLDAHPARPDSDDSLWNEATFPPALIAACTGRPLDEAREWYEESSASDGDQLFEECLRASAPGSVAFYVRLLRENPRRYVEAATALSMGIPLSKFLSWSPEDQDWAIAVREVDGDVCPGGCGAPNKDRENYEAFVVEHMRCVNCQKLEAARNEVPADQKGHVHVRLVPNPKIPRK